MTTLKPPPAPTGLKARGKSLWNSILTIYQLDPGEMVLLTELCRSADKIDALDADIATEGLLVTGKRGQVPKANPLLMELREAQRTVSRLVAEIALPLPGETKGRRRSPQQKRAAETRWNRAARRNG